MRPGTALRGALTVLLTTATLAVAAPAQAALSLTPAFTDSTVDPVDTPIYVTAPPGDSSRLFVAERSGRIRVAVDGVMRDTPFLDLNSPTTRVSTNGEGGLLSMAFAPDYATSGKFYVYFVEVPDPPGPNGDIRIEEFTRDPANANVALPSSRLILEIAHDSAGNHYGGTIAFNKDGVLYAAPGDAATGGAESQNPSTNLGKVLALDTDSTPGASVVALGLRNPFRFSFDRLTGDLVLADVGENTWEEIDWLEAGTFANVNFGWPCYEGFATRSTSVTCSSGTLTPPILAYGRSAGHSVTGGVVVRDPALGALFGRYVYADHFTGDVRSLKLGKPATEDRSEGLPIVPRVAAFGEDADARVYVVSLFNPGGSAYGGKVWRIACDASCGSAGAGAGGAAGTNPPPAGDGGSQSPPPGPAVNPPAQADTVAPVLRTRAARRQDVLRRLAVRLSVSCNENCIVRATGSARGLRLRGALKRLDAGERVVFELRVSERLRSALRHRGTIAVTLRGRDAAGNLRTVGLTVRVKRPAR
ncbi:MAG TPA: PQQ-dependent sugar dehydrogenase [Thermoleophilaceae bacterium]